MNIYKAQLLVGKLYSRKPEYKKKLDFAITGIEKMLEIAPKSYISLSFGKQSICLAHMVQQIDKKIPAYFLASDETWAMYNYAEVIEKVKKLMPELEINIKQTNHFFNADSWKEARDLGDKDLQNMCDRKEWDGWLWGLAKEESLARKYTCSKNNTDSHKSLFRYTDNKYRCTPIQDWGINDLAAYINEYNLPMLNIYEKYGLECRTTARITKKCRDLSGTSLMRGTSKDFRKLANTHEEITF